jgi:hypothetical protein
MSNRLSSGLQSKSPDVLDNQMGPETYTELENCNAPAVCNGRRICERAVVAERRIFWLATQKFHRNASAWCINCNQYYRPSMSQPFRATMKTMNLCFQNKLPNINQQNASFLN